MGCMNGNNKIYLGIIAILALTLGTFLLFSGEEENEVPEEPAIPSSVVAHIASKSNLIVLDSPKPYAIVASPLTISGKARGNWYFEADFPIRIEDANGKVLGKHYAEAQGEWMTENFVPFRGTLSFSAPSTSTGTLILEKNNASGLPQNANELRIPIKFQALRTVKLYYYNPALDKDANGNILCSEKGLVSLNRIIPVTQTPIQDTIRLLLKGELTVGEKAQGVTTEFPLQGFELTGASVNNEVLTLSFKDPNNKTGGGSCRVNILWAQIKKTGEQFSTITEVRFLPQTLFQP